MRRLLRQTPVRKIHEVVNKGGVSITDAINDHRIKASRAVISAER